MHSLDTDTGGLFQYIKLSFLDIGIPMINKMVMRPSYVYSGISYKIPIVKIK